MTEMVLPKRPASSTSISAISSAVTRNAIYDKYPGPSDIKGENPTEVSPQLDKPEAVQG